MQIFFKDIKDSFFAILKKITTIMSLFYIVILLLFWPQLELDIGASYINFNEGSKGLKEFTKSMNNIRRIRVFGNETILYDAWSKFKKEILQF